MGVFRGNILVDYNSVKIWCKHPNKLGKYRAYNCDRKIFLVWRNAFYELDHCLALACAVDTFLCALQRQTAFWADRLFRVSYLHKLACAQTVVKKLHKLCISKKLILRKTAEADSFTAFQRSLSH